MANAKRSRGHHGFLSRLALIVLSLGVMSRTGYAQEVSLPVIAGDFADPSVIQSGEQYFAVGTSSEWAPHFPIYRSADLKNWKLQAYVFKEAPAWTSGSFWAPEYFFHNGLYYVYYTARRKSDNISCIGVAVSKYPDRDFQDKGIVVDYGKEAIDAFVVEDKGQLYMTFKAYGLDDRPIELLGSKLSADGLRLEGKIFSLLRDDERIGMEGQSIVKKGDEFYLFYSVGNCCGADCSYAVRVAKSHAITGPFIKNTTGPVLVPPPGWKCAGHGTFVKAAGEDYYLHHAYRESGGVFTGRQGMLAQLSWPGNTAWPKLIPVGATSVSTEVTDEFDGEEPALYWQHDFRNAKAVLTQKGGKLSLTGSFSSRNEVGVVATVRPVSAAFEMETGIANQNGALKGLVLYGDVGDGVGLGVTNDALEFWMVVDNSRSVVKRVNLQSASLVRLRMVIDHQQRCKAYYRKGNEWVDLTPGTSLDISFLPQWDRSPRPGLQYRGPVGEAALFEDFKIRFR